MRRYLLHYPRLVLSDTSIEVLGGTLKTLDFATFEELDRDWARETYFERTRPAFWIIDGDPSDAGATADPADANDDDDFAPTRRTAMLIYNALLAVTGGLYPDPRLSMEYHSYGQGVSRRVGPFERTWLLNGGGLEPITDEELGSLGVLAEKWHEHGFRYDDFVFSPLRGLASLASTFINPVLGMLPLIVSLEGFLIPGRVKGIAQHMAVVIKHLLGEAVPEDIEEFIRAVYKARSRVVHGEQIPVEKISEICDRLQQLTGAVVIAAAREMMNRKLDSQNFDTLRKEWMPS